MEKTVAWKYGFAALCVIAGLAFNAYGVGAKAFAGFGSLGDWLVYIGILCALVVTLQMFVRKGRKTDERMEFVAAKAARATFVAFFLIAFLVIVMDGISQITMPYHLFMSYLVCVLMLVYLGAYHVLLRRY